MNSHIELLVVHQDQARHRRQASEARLARELQPRTARWRRWWPPSRPEPFIGAAPLPVAG